MAKSISLCIAGYLLLFSNTVLALENRLADHASPYLAMHGQDPVAWQEWNPATIQQARTQNKLVFVSSGYFSCHWCHVMQKESYRNTEIAKLLNQYFIPVKVDRELHSALDSRLIDFVERTQGSAGWPLNVFVTADGYPLVGMTYVPPDNFLKILQTLQGEWSAKSAQLKQLAQAAAQELATAEVATSPELPKDLAAGLMDIFINQAFGYGDDMLGGFGQENKFPSVPQLDLLLEIYQHKPDEQIRKFAGLTLDQMSSQGLWDQLGGGFYRYVVDPQWQVPHFEKMLYDNALLAKLYYKAAVVLNNASYRDIADQTLDFINTELATRRAGYAASLSAVDDKNVEGGYYLWDVDSLKKLLNSQEFAVASRYWRVSGPPDLDHGHHLVQGENLTELAAELKLEQQQIKSRLDSARQKMLKQRSQRVLPRDDKILTSWNGLALSAFAEGAKHNKAYYQSASRLADFIYTELWDKKQQRLHKAVANKGSLGPGVLEDYAYVARGLLDWWQVSKDKKSQQLLEQVINQAWLRFYGKQGWILAEDMLLKYGSGMTMISDSVLPSASSVMVQTSYQYATQTNNKKLQSRALQAMNAGFQELQSNAFWQASQIKSIMQVQLD